MCVWVRLFLNKHDRHGVLIKVMHGSALMYESTVMPIELGRCTHHEGNPYFAFHMLLSQKEDMAEATKILEENVLHDKMGKCREYIHFPNTFEAQGEKGMRIVTPNQNMWPQEKPNGTLGNNGTVHPANAWRKCVPAERHTLGLHRCLLNGLCRTN